MTDIILQWQLMPAKGRLLQAFTTVTLLFPTTRFMNVCPQSILLNFFPSVYYPNILVLPTSTHMTFT